MPWRVKLEDGSEVLVDGSPDKQPTEDQITSAFRKEKEEIPSAFETFSTSFAGGVPAQIAGSEAGTLAQVITRNRSPWISIPATIAAAGAAAVNTDKAKIEAERAARPDLLQREARGQIMHPGAALAGNLAAPWSLFKATPQKTLGMLAKLRRYNQLTDAEK